MLRAVLLATKKQSRAQGVAHVRHATRHESARHQSCTIPYHDSARGGAAARVRASGEWQIFKHNPSILHDIDIVERDGDRSVNLEHHFSRLFPRFFIPAKRAELSSREIVASSSRG